MLRLASVLIVFVALSMAAFTALHPLNVGAAPAAEGAGLVAQGPGTPRPQGPGGPPPGEMMRPAPVDSFVSDRDSLMNDMLQHIAGRENMPAESVFKNIKVMKGVPAGRLLRAMNMGFGRSLGVGCNYCHIVGHWADEDKPKKEIARGMMQMVSTINEEILPKIKNLGDGGDDKPRVNCGMCHRGERRPGHGFGRGQGRPPGSGPAPEH
jgi:hypothetical protein